MYDHLERCETCGEIVPETEIHYNAETGMTCCEQPECGLYN